MLFDEFCDKNKIKCWREAFYHHCVAKLTTEICDATMTEEQWNSLWNEFLSAIAL